MASASDLEGGRSPTGPADWAYLLVWITFVFLRVRPAHPAQVANVIQVIWCKSTDRAARATSLYKGISWSFGIIWTLLNAFLAVSGWLVQRSESAAFESGWTTVHHPYTYSVLFLVITIAASKFYESIYFSYLQFEAAMALTLALAVTAAVSLWYTFDIAHESNRWWLIGTLFFYIAWVLAMFIGQAIVYPRGADDLRGTPSLPREDEWVLSSPKSEVVAKSRVKRKELTV